VFLLLPLQVLCIGFAWFNCHPAEVTSMGDTGSLALGASPWQLSNSYTRQNSFLVVIGGVFVLEALSVVIQGYLLQTQRWQEGFLE